MHFICANLNTFDTTSLWQVIIVIIIITVIIIRINIETTSLSKLNIKTDIEICNIVYTSSLNPLWLISLAFTVIYILILFLLRLFRKSNLSNKMSDSNFAYYIFSINDKPVNAKYIISDFYMNLINPPSITDY